MGKENVSLAKGMISQPFAQNPYLSAAMDHFEHHTLRDPSYRARFQAKLAEIEAVREKHSFLEYANRQYLFDELQAIYDENLQRYQQAYLRNLEAFVKVKEISESQKADMHPIRYREARELYEKTEQCLAKESYTENERAKELISRLERHIDVALEEMRTWEQTASDWETQLDTHLKQIWSEEYTALRSRFTTVQADIHATDRLPQLPLSLRPQDIEQAIIHKKEAISSLQPKAAFSSKLSQTLQDLSDNASSKADFEVLVARVKRARRMRMMRWTLLFVAVGGLLIASLYMIPRWMRGQAEEEIWAYAQEQNSLQSYQIYLESYPDGIHAGEALSAQRSVPFGKLDSLFDQHGRLFSYEGSLQQMIPEGSGKAIYADGGIYEGAFLRGVPDSMGMYIQPDGVKYEGMWAHGFKVKGTQTLLNGDMYSGQWKDDLYHGYGSLKLADGTDYRGNWVKGIKEGKGKVVWPDGASYEGDWKADQFNGQGVYIDSLRVTYDGNWVDGKRQGAGEVIWKDSLIFEGAWHQDMREGKGTLIWVKTNARFEAQWLGDTINGPGVFLSTKPTRLELTGTWTGTTDRLHFYYGDQLHNVYQIIGHGMLVPIRD